mmetsp:Transcript_18259/g.35871  ORF Transcript_18259/g.35871 Transcript_18259/m.35871 type:complete len:116 (+) Transcript_18259:165-512(+)
MLSETGVSEGGHTRDLDLEGAQRAEKIIERDGYHFGDEGAKALANVLKNNPNFWILSLRHNQVGPEGTKALAEMLINRPRRKRSVALYYGVNKIRSEGAAALALVLKANALEVLG